MTIVNTNFIFKQNYYSVQDICYTILIFIYIYIYIYIYRI